tara:strand:+ start:2353 stop:4764 length:2412 start_codon:yes stop_codon:yes gene_type:complete
MSLFRLDSNYFDTFKVLAKPKRSFVSSSSGITGSIKVFPDASTAVKEVADTSTDITFDDGGLEDLRASLLTDGVSEAGLQEYINVAHSITENSRFDKRVEILRFEPSVKFTSDTLRKNVIKKNLFPYYKRSFGRPYNWSFTNYNTLNFFTTYDEEVPADTVLMYPASSSFQYRPTGSFSFEFYVNPRYKEVVKGTYPAGTLLHLSSSYAVSLVSGSSKDPDGYVDKFRLMLQLSHSADLPPTSCSLGMTGVRSEPFDFIFSSSDNSLSRNTWHHCCIRWDNNSQGSTGSFMIDGTEAGNFAIPTIALSGSYLQRELPTTTERGGITVNCGPPDVLFVGNFYDGPNSLDPSGDEDFTAQFFNPVAAYKDGLPNYYAPTYTHDSPGPVTEPDTFLFEHPLNAEVHDLKIYDRYRTDYDIQSAMTGGFTDIEVEKSNGLIFYVPPFFVKETKERDILQTPFQTKRGSTDDPFNVPMSFGIGGHYINLENFVKELVSGSFPRLYNLSGSEIANSTDWVSANGFLYATGSIRKRNLTILPSDNGLFFPRFELLSQVATGSALSLYVDDAGNRDLSMVHLDNLLPTGSIGEGLLGQESTGSLSAQLQGPSPDDPSIPEGSILTIYNRTRDPSSNEISIFDASNLFYGNKIDPGSYILTDTSLTGSGGRISITLRDHSGSLYRADCLSPVATWNDVGVLMYDEGIGVVKTPLFPRFGADQFSINLVGQQNLHVLRMDIPANRAEMNISNNPTFKQLEPTSQLPDKGVSFCYVTNVNLHDENLNIIGKTSFSQAIVKRENDKFVVRVKLDF